MLKEIEVKGIQVFYHDCCCTEEHARKYALAENYKNYVSGKVDRLKAIFKGHDSGCKEA